ncbi:MAG: endonuclease/exonuclease/phosphatase family protein [Phycisphaerales bacterium]|jgi:endonuclease/exonuclease/phosphatase family metal-dependent hydrolase|nr:endonuclease/exonuclease/phosphatase family protein [Phycisphaerales bacterium]
MASTSFHGRRSAFRPGKVGAGVVVLIVLVCLGVVGGSTWLAKRSQQLAEDAVVQARDAAAKAQADAESKARESLKLADQAQDRAQPPADPTPTTLDQTKAPQPPAGAIDTAAIRFGTRAMPRKSDVVRIATYNVANLFDDRDDPILQDRYEDLNTTKPTPELEGVAAAIRAIDADVLVLEEVESDAVLRWFRDTYLSGLGYTEAISIDAGDPRGIEQGVLSRFPLAEPMVWPRMALQGKHPAGADAPEGEPIAFHRSPFRIEVIVPEGARGNAREYNFTIYAIHAKSGRNSGYWREAEAIGTTKLIHTTMSDDPGRNVMVMGDFNAVQTDASFQSFISAGLIDLFADRRPDDPATTTHESGRSIDHVLVNAAMMPEVIRDSRFVFGTPARPKGVDYRTYPAPKGYGSDHYPVVVDIRPMEGGATPATPQNQGGKAVDPAAK